MKVPLELKRRYLSRRISELQCLRNSLLENDYSLALRLGHQVKGNAATFEFPQMTQFGVGMEIAAKRKDKEMIQQIIKKMETFILGVNPQ